MKKVFNQFLFAFGFLTIIPGLGGIKVSNEDTGKSVIFYPVVGLTIGFFLYLISLLNGLTPLTLSVIMCVFILFFSRGIHADGLLDTIDGFLSGRKKKEEIISVMRDPGLGALGFVGAFSLYTLKICLFYEILLKGTDIFPFYLLAAPALSRGGVAVAGYIFPYGGGDKGLGKSFVSSISLKQVLISFLLMLLSSFSRDYLLSLLSAPLISIFWIVWGFICKRKIGGITGDTIGAGIEMSEVFYLILVIVLF